VDTRFAARILAAVVLIGGVAIITTDYVRMGAAAAEHIEILRAELEKIPPVPRTERIGVRETRKSRSAAVRARYGGPASIGQIFGHYERAFSAREWRPCGRTGTTLISCRGEYEAIIAVPSSDGPGSYSVVLEWDRVTWPVWLSAGALIYLVAISAAVLLDGRGPDRRAPDTVCLRSRRPVSECLSRLKAGPTAMTLRHRSTGGFGLSFELHKGRGRIVRPHFYGRLEPDPAAEGTILTGRFGLAPGARGSFAAVGVLILLAIVFASYGSPGSVQGLVWVVIIPTVGLLLEWWASRKQRYEILEFLNTIVSSG